MNRLVLCLIGLGFALSIAGCMSSKQQEEKPPLLDRNLFFGNPEISGAQISPDGDYVAFQKPYKGVMNIWVKETGADFEDAQPITADTTRPVRGYFWSKNSDYVLYVQDKGGDENFNIYAVDPSAEVGDLGVPSARNLTDLENVRAQILAVPDATPNEIIVGLNDRNPQLHDVYRLNIETGERELIRQNDQGIAGWVVDNNGELRLGVRQTQSGGTELLRIDGDELVKVFEVDNEEALNPIRFHKDNEQVYMATNKDRDLNSLFLFNPQNEELSLVESDPENEVDFNGAIFSNETHELLATTYVGDRLRVYPKDEQFKQDYEFLKSELPDGEINFGAHTSDDQRWIINIEQDVDPGSTYLYDRSDQTLAKLYESRPELESNHLAEMKPIRYPARDGLEIPAYLTVPKGYGEKGLPVIVLPHGGPWARDTWGYSPMVQFLANRGYAVFQPNFRGSTGYGKEFLNAGNEEWGTGYMQHDITDGVKYLIEEGIADSSRVAIYGGSYGGYATLAGLAFTPDLYAAGVSFVGPSNIITLLNSIPPYWEPIRKIFAVRVGDLDDPEDVERMKEQSPLFSASQITAPLMVIQGANDPRVKKQESDQIVQALRELNREVQYIVAPDEGHGFAGEENRIAAYAAMEEFFANHIGGRYQEDMKPEIEQRLKEITVDISTVNVEGIED
ncbi:S9 family peptidase [Fodinibius sp. SL11]|uniref:S9 family peptidase n=1 Tax=Fodinibius sp. SL11 TaxID=3425690 RepID=UPI003F8817A3